MAVPQVDPPPPPSRRLFWAIVGSCIGLFALTAFSLLILRAPTESMVTDGSLLRTLGVEGLLAAAWVPVLRRRGWTLGCMTAPLEVIDLARGLGLYAGSYLAYWFAFDAAILLWPRVSEVARGMPLGGAPSWWVVALVSLVNPVAEEFLYLGFITNVLKSEGFQVALVAGVLARVTVHVYQGPAGVASAVASGLVLGAYYLKANRLWPVVVAHGLADLVGLGLLAGGAASS